jgi:hypothetical protein
MDNGLMDEMSDQFGKLLGYETSDSASGCIMYNSRTPTFGVYSGLPYTLYRTMIMFPESE